MVCKGDGLRKRKKHAFGDAMTTSGLFEGNAEVWVFLAHGREKMNARIDAHEATPREAYGEGHLLTEKTTTKTI